MDRDARKGSGLFSARSFSDYLKIVSLGASSVASTVRSAGASIAASIAEDRAMGDQANWAGFDNLECGDGSIHKVLLLAYRSGFDVWDVEVGDDVHQLASRQDGPVSFLQILKTPVASKKCKDKFADFRPLLVVCRDWSYTVDVLGFPNSQDQGSEINVQFYSLKVHSYVHAIKLRAPVYSIRCGPRVVAVCQASQIHCFDAATLERDYTLLTYPIVSRSSYGGMGYGPLAVGTRWLAYSGPWVIVNLSGRINSQAPDSLISSPLNGSLVAHYAKESGKQLAAGLVTLGDLGYKKLSRYCSRLFSDVDYFTEGSQNCNSNGRSTKDLIDEENTGMVIVHDIVSRSVIVQFKAHNSPISALCFDPSGTLLVTASICGHNINIFLIMPSPCGHLSISNADGSYEHLYKLQRGFTNAVIQDISFSFDSRYITISSSKGTSHLFALSAKGATTSIHPADNKVRSNDYSESIKSPTEHSCIPGSQLVKSKINQRTATIILSPITRIRNGSNGWTATVSDVASAAVGKTSFPCGVISSTFHTCKYADVHSSIIPASVKYYMLLFSPAGCLTQYMLQHTFCDGSPEDIIEYGSFSSHRDEATLVIEALQKWDFCHERIKRVNGRTVDVYGESGSKNSRFAENATRKGTNGVAPPNAMKHNMKVNSEDDHYISEVELHMHSAQEPLWTKSKINFHRIRDDITAIRNDSVNGEIEIERIPARAITVRSKDLIPSSNFSQLPRFQQSRLDVSEVITNELSSRTSSHSDGDFSSQGGSNIDHLSSIPAFLKLSSGAAETNWGSHLDALQSKAVTVNSKDSLNVIPQEHVGKVLSVHNIGSPRMESLFLDGDNDID